MTDGRDTTRTELETMRVDLTLGPEDAEAAKTKSTSNKEAFDRFLTSKRKH